MDDFLQDKTSANPDASAIPLQRSTLISNNALVFNRGDIRFMILNLKDNFADYNVISNLLVSLSNLTCSSQ
jgi:hypothetical protein